MVLGDDGYWMSRGCKAVVTGLKEEYRVTSAFTQLHYSLQHEVSRHNLPIKGKSTAFCVGVRLLSRTTSKYY